MFLLKRPEFIVIPNDILIKKIDELKRGKSTEEISESKGSRISLKCNGQKVFFSNWTFRRSSRYKPFRGDVDFFVLMPCNNKGDQGSFLPSYGKRTVI